MRSVLFCFSNGIKIKLTGVSKLPHGSRGCSKLHFVFFYRGVKITQHNHPPFCAITQESLALWGGVPPPHLSRHTALYNKKKTPAKNIPPHFAPKYNNSQFWNYNVLLKSHNTMAHTLKSSRPHIYFLQLARRLL